MSQKNLSVIIASMDSITSLGAEYVSRAVASIGVGEIVGCVTAAVVLVVPYIIYSQVSVPRPLRHLPYIPLSKTIAALFRNESRDIIQHNLYLPEYRKHGLVVNWDGSWHVSVVNPEHAKMVLTRLETFPKRELFVGETGFRLFARFIGSSNILFRNGDHWKRHRKIVNPAFHRSMPVKLFSTMTQKMCEQFETDDNHVNIHKYMQRFTLDVIGKAGFGFDFHSIESSKSSWTDIYNDIVEGSVSPLYNLFPILEKNLWAFPKRRELHRKMDKLNTLFQEIIQNKKRVIQQEGYEPREDEDSEKDLLTMMIEANETEKLGGLSDEELRDNLCIFFLAGHDTTASAMSSVVYFLAADKAIQQKAREEVIAILGDAPEDVFPTITQTNQLKYVNQILKESMRFYPPAPGTQARTITTDIDLGPYHIPKGSDVNVDIYAMHHNPDYWTNPEHFDPERFAEGGENEARKTNFDNSYFWIPFSSGARQCIGMNFSLVEQRVVLSMLLRKYEWSLPTDSIHKDGMKLDPKSPLILAPLDLIIDFHPRY